MRLVKCDSDNWIYFRDESTDLECCKLIHAKLPWYYYRVNGTHVRKDIVIYNQYFL